MGALTLLTTKQSPVDEELAGPEPTMAQTSADEAIAEILSEKNDLGESTGIIAYDRIAGMMRPGEYTVIGGMTGDGKSAWGLTVGGNVALRGAGVLYCATADMTSKELMLRLACSWAGVSAKRAHNHELQSREKEFIISIMSKFRDLPLVLDAQHGKTVQAIEEQVKRVRSRLAVTGRRLRLVIIDYIQETGYQGAPKDWNEERTLRNVSRVLKEIAQRHFCHVLGLVQAHPPPPTKKGEKQLRPSVDNIQNSKAIAKPASTVGFISRIKDEHGFYPARGKANIVLAKARWGGALDIPVVFDGPCGRFEEDTEAPLPE
jgi:replicative DNA helicase